MHKLLKRAVDLRVKRVAQMTPSAGPLGPNQLRLAKTHRNGRQPRASLNGYVRQFDTPLLPRSYEAQEGCFRFQNWSVLNPLISTLSGRF
jgi:hypothetical protein